DDPLPALRRLADAHTSGRAIVPERFGGSANSEFEVLTGMSTSFLPERSVAYKQYLKRRIPSLSCLLAARGYRTVAVQADPITYFDRTKAYEHLCFERVVWLNEDPTAPRALNGRAPTDEAVVDAVLAAIHHEGPAFVFAFPSSTHHPYELDLYSESDLDLVDASHPARRELKYYVNALRVADAAVERLAAGLSAIDRRVVLAIVGDHLPPLSTEALGAFRARLENLSEDERNLVERRVPLVVWSNFARDRRELELGLNALAPYLLDLAGVEPDGFLRFVGRFGERVPVLTLDVIGIGGTPLRPASIPEEHARWIDDYRLLQHDALFGASYLSRLLETSDIVKAAMPLE
ncbi:MAG: LTA synthase family protein, partial [Gammaproteobacteria bacterium]